MTKLGVIGMLLGLGWMVGPQWNPTLEVIIATLLIVVACIFLLMATEREMKERFT